MPENRILCLKPTLRLEWRGQNGQDKTEQSEHDPQTLDDSFGQSMRMKFSVHTRRGRFRAAPISRRQPPPAGRSQRNNARVETPNKPLYFPSLRYLRPRMTRTLLQSLGPAGGFYQGSAGTRHPSELIVLALHA